MRFELPRDLCAEAMFGGALAAFVDPGLRPWGEGAWTLMGLEKPSPVAQPAWFQNAGRRGGRRKTKKKKKKKKKKQRLGEQAPWSSAAFWKSVSRQSSCHTAGLTGLQAVAEGSEGGDGDPESAFARLSPREQMSAYVAEKRRMGWSMKAAMLCWSQHPLVQQRRSAAAERRRLALERRIARAACGGRRRRRCVKAAGL